MGSCYAFGFCGTRVKMDKTKRHTILQPPYGIQEKKEYYFMMEDKVSV